ncbi:MAG: glycine cleavage system protein H [Candidatus Hydrothermarchaeales archaeon]
MVEIEGFNLPDEFYYIRRDHIWTKVEGDKVRIGLDQFGQCSAGRVAYIKIKPKGREIEKGRPFGTLECGKYIGPLKAPVSGVILEVNEAVLQNPELVNDDPYGEGWMIIAEPSNFEEDSKDLVHGEDVKEWLEKEIVEYRKKGLLQCE